MKVYCTKRRRVVVVVVVPVRVSMVLVRTDGVHEQACAVIS